MLLTLLSQVPQTPPALRIRIANPEILHLLAVLFLLYPVFASLKKAALSPNDSNTMIVAFLLASAYMALICFGYYPWSLLEEILPWLSFLRVHARIGILILLFMSVIVSMFIDRWITSIRAIRTRAVVSVSVPLVLACFILIESYPFVRFTETPEADRIPPVYRWLKEQADISTIVELPISFGSSVQYEMASLYHRKNMVNGYSGYEPAWYRSFAETMTAFPSRKALDILAEHRVDLAIVHKNGIERWSNLVKYTDFLPFLNIAYEDDRALALRFQPPFECRDAILHCRMADTQETLCKADIRVIVRNRVLSYQTDEFGTLALGAIPQEAVIIEASHFLCELKQSEITGEKEQNPEIELGLDRNTKGIHSIEGQFIWKETKPPHVLLELFVNNRKILDRVTVDPTYTIRNLPPEVYQLTLKTNRYYPPVAAKTFDLRIESPTNTIWNIPVPNSP